MKKDKVKKIIAVILLIISVTGLCIVGTILYKHFHEIKQGEDEVAQLKELVGSTVGDVTGDYLDDTPVISDRAKELYQLNSDFVGWLYIDGPGVDYPVMQTPEDEQFYIHRNFEKKYSSNGSLFCSAQSDVRTPSQNIIIYGHHMNAHNVMFNGLMAYEKEDFYKEHKYITFETIYGTREYEIIAAYRTAINNTEYKYYEFYNGTEEEFFEYVNYAKSKTPYETADVKYGDNLISLSTCAYHTRNGRYVVVAKQIK